MASPTVTASCACRRVVIGASGMKPPSLASFVRVGGQGGGQPRIGAVDVIR